MAGATTRGNSWCTATSVLGKSAIGCMYSGIDLFLCVRPCVRCSWYRRRGFFGYSATCGKRDLVLLASSFALAYAASQPGDLASDQQINPPLTLIPVHQEHFRRGPDLNQKPRQERVRNGPAIRNSIWLGRLLYSAATLLGATPFAPASLLTGQPKTRRAAQAWARSDRHVRTLGRWLDRSSGPGCP